MFTRAAIQILDPSSSQLKETSVGSTVGFLTGILGEDRSTIGEQRRTQL